MLDAGRALEPVALKWLAGHGWTVRLNADAENGQIRSEAGGQMLEGRHDAFMGGLDDVVIEVKTRGPYAFRRWRELVVERSSTEVVTQAALYTFSAFGKARDAMILTVDMGSRVCDIIPDERIESAYRIAMARMGEVEMVVRSRALPDPDFPEVHCALELGNSCGALVCTRHGDTEAMPDMGQARGFSCARRGDGDGNRWKIAKVPFNPSDLSWPHLSLSPHPPRRRRVLLQESRVWPIVQRNCLE